MYVYTHITFKKLKIVLNIYNNLIKNCINDWTQYYYKFYNDQYFTSMCMRMRS